MLQELQMWSEKEQQIVSWTVTRTEEIDEGGNVHRVILIQHDDEIHRYSPSATDSELLRFAASNQGGI